jgi:hypothetical protein
MIYELWLWKNTPGSNRAWENRTEAEDESLKIALSDEAMKSCGAEWVLYCDSAWTDEEYRNWGITAYSSIEMRIAHTRALQKAGWFRMGEMASLLGILDNAASQPKKPDYPNPIYQLFIMRQNPVTHANYSRLTGEEQQRLWAAWEESVKRHNLHQFLFCKSGWCNEEKPFFGVITFPNIAARQAHWDDLDALNWWQYVSAFTLLGIEQSWDTGSDDPGG